MKCLLVLSAAICAGASSLNIPDGHPLVNWRPAGPGDVRSPCPMLNALANHGILPHDGKNITQEQTINALKSSINLNEDLAKTQFEAALMTNPNPHASTYSLDDLCSHGILEHDASLSRQDYYFGNDHTFNQAIFDQTRSHWTGSFIDVEQAARARQARVDMSNATNPDFDLSGEALSLTYGESAAYIVVFGNKSSGIVNKSWVEYFFQYERLPTALGWTKNEDEVTSSDQQAIAQKIIDATNNHAEEKCVVAKRSDHHMGHKTRGHHR
ncbi:hypothetical protein PMG11_09028 [Penicillium brasilianum]|uniref:Heme haloperoxidase family profile domain-containing protein n=1 Tax=Penicillium brasilianum TaxID=104259 RepID=A0A0F7TYK6_PENBI|nr:hypothetical protein PMG11_09028 [Penicillium brasilianum]